MARPADLWEGNTGSMGEARSDWWRAAGLVLAAVGLIVGIFHETAVSMVQVWHSSETFTHGFLIVPIVLFLVWYRRHDLAAVTPRPWPWALLGVAGAGAAWLLGAVGGVTGVQHFALVAMIVATVGAVLGHAAARVLMFPLAYLFFAVPFGAFLIQPLMVLTADFSVALVRLSGIPVYREGLEFALPTGTWAVVEACSGIRYLIASVTLGLLYAYLMYRSLWRRLLFVAASIAVPILANGLRAYMIVMIGHYSGMEYAVGVDHLVYGWVFFGVVIFLLFWIGSWWREDGAAHERPRALQGARGVGSAGIVVTSAAAVLLAGLWPLYAAQIEAADGRSAGALIAPQGAGEWQQVADSQRLGGWRPEYAAPLAEVRQAYARDSVPLGLFIGYYQDQLNDADMLAWNNRLAPSMGDGWRQMGLRQADRPGMGAQPAEALLARGSERMLAWRWYWVDGYWTASRVEAKARIAFARLRHRGDAAAVVVIHTPFEHRADEARERLAGFAREMLPDVGNRLEEVRP